MTETTVVSRPTSPTACAAAGLAFAGPTSMTALSLSRCQTITLPGPEDVVIDAEAGIAYVSSQARPLGYGARRYTEAGAIYTLRLDDAVPVPRNAMPAASGLPGGLDPANFHPHGIDLVVDGRGTARLFAINHAEGGARVEIFNIVDRGTGMLAHVRTIGPDAAIKSPNDIAAVDLNEFYLSNSHDTENRILAGLEDVLHLRTASVAHCRFPDRGRADVAVVEAGFTFLSGIAVDRTVDPKQVYVAPLWTRKIIVYEQTADGGLTPTGREIELPGGVDNLNFDAYGNLWIGAAPDFAALMAYALAHREVAPSLVLRVADPRADTPKIEQVFTDDGRLLSAASAAAYCERAGRRRLLVGAPFQDRMLVIEMN